MSHSLDISCSFIRTEFSVNNESFYTCFIEGLEIPRYLTYNFIGNHEPNKTNDDIEAVYIKNCKLSRWMYHLTEYFPNYKVLNITNSCLDFIRKEDFEYDLQLRELYIENNPLFYLPGNIFKDMVNLEVISFKNNKIKFIEKYLLNGLENLKHVDFRGNTNIDKCFDSIGNAGNATLFEIKFDIQENCRVNWREMFIQADHSLNRYKQWYFAISKRSEEKSDENKDLKEKIEQKDAEISGLKGEKEANAAEIANLKNTIQKHEETFNHQMTALKAENDKLSTEIRDLHENISKLKDEHLNCDAFNDFRQFIDRDEYKDFTIIIGDKTFKAHKLILASRSSALAEMIKNNPNASQLQLYDISSESFGEILEFMYKNQMPKNDANFIEIFMTAGKLKIEKLKEFSAEKLLNMITPDNAIEVLALANKFHNEELKMKAFNEIRKMFPEKQLKDEFAELPDTLRRLVENKIKRNALLREAEKENEEIWKEFNEICL